MDRLIAPSIRWPAERSTLGTTGVAAAQCARGGDARDASDRAEGKPRRPPDRRTPTVPGRRRAERGPSFETAFAVRRLVRRSGSRSRPILGAFRPLPGKTRTLLIVAAGLLLLVIAAVAVLLLGDYDSERLGEEVLARLGPVLGMELEAEGFRLRPLRGLEIRGLRGHGSLPAGELELSARRLVLEHSLLSLLGGTFRVHEVRLEEPVVELVSGGAGAPAAASRATDAATASRAADAGAGEAADGSALRLRIDQIRLEDGSFRAHAHAVTGATGADGAPASAVELHDLDVVLDGVAFDSEASSPLAGWRAQGEASFERALLNGTEISEGEGGLRLDDGHFRVEDFRVRLDAGPARLVDLDVDLTREPFVYDLSLSGEPLDTNAFVLPAGAARPDEGFGPSSLALALDGRGADPGTLAGGGSLAVQPGTIPPIALFQVIDALLEDVHLAGSRYEPFELNYRVEGPRVSFEPARLVTETLVVSLESGWADLAGPIDLRMTLRAPRELFAGVEEIPRELLTALADDDDRVVLPFQVTGTLEAPRLAVDRSGFRDRLGAGVQREVERRLRDEVARGLRGLLGGEDDEDEEVEEPPP